MIHSIVCIQFLPLITRTCNVSEGIVDLGDHLVFRYFLLKRSCLRFWWINLWIYARCADVTWFDVTTSNA